MTKTDDPLAFRIFNEIGIIEQLSRNRIERVLPEGLTLPQFTVLNHFVRLGGERSPARLASAFQVTKQTMTSTLQRLERSGFIEMRPDPDDGRGKRVAITEKGRQMRQDCLAAMAPVLKRLTEIVGNDHLGAALPLLVELRKKLDENRE